MSSRLRRQGALPDFDLLVGTSAGAAVAALLGVYADVGMLFDRECEGRWQAPDVRTTADPSTIAQIFSAFVGEDGRPPVGEELSSRLVQIGRLAKTVSSIGLQTYNEEVGRYLGTDRWPAIELLVTAVECDTGRLVVLSRDSGVDLATAVAASSAVPGMMPVVKVMGRPLMDGGPLSPLHCDLLLNREVSRALVVAPIAGTDPVFGNLVSSVIQRELADLRRSGVESLDIMANQNDVEAMGGIDRMNPALRAAAARAGLERGMSEATRIAVLRARDP